jgi:hypothetical protein
METQPVPENDVLIGIAIWLHSQGWQIKKVSMAGGQKIDMTAQKQKLKSNFVSAGIPLDTIKFIRNGPDIEAIKENNIWKIECKGLGDVKPATLKNNFDRAVASAVSYYDRSKELLIGLAFPEVDGYMKLMREKLPRALREAINLWLFIYVDINEIYEFAPTDEI